MLAIYGEIHTECASKSKGGIQQEVKAKRFDRIVLEPFWDRHQAKVFCRPALLRERRF